VLNRIVTISFMVFSFVGCAHTGLDTLASGKNVQKAVVLMPRVHFVFDSDRLTPEGRGIIYHNVGWMKENPAEIIILEGHCDERGSADYNLYLGDRRARVVRSELVAMGADDDSLIIISYGEERPLDVARNREAWRRNRRVEFVVR
jgi:peptidoglycan-associated lipoprotein